MTRAEWPTCPRCQDQVPPASMQGGLCGMCRVAARFFKSDPPPAEPEIGDSLATLLDAINAADLCRDQACKCGRCTACCQGWGCDCDWCGVVEKAEAVSRLVEPVEAMRVAGRASGEGERA